MIKRRVDVKPQVLMIRQAAQASLEGEASVVKAMRIILVEQLAYMTVEQFVAAVQNAAGNIIEEEEAK